MCVVERSKDIITAAVDTSCDAGQAAFHSSLALSFRTGLSSSCCSRVLGVTERGRESSVGPDSS